LILRLSRTAPGYVRRIEVITGAGWRRRWSEAEKALAVEESLAPDAVVSQVARRHGATPQQLFTWRRKARRRAEAEGVPAFVPDIAENSGAAVRPPHFGGVPLSILYDNLKIAVAAKRFRTLL